MICWSSVASQALANEVSDAPRRRFITPGKMSLIRPRAASPAPRRKTMTVSFQILRSRRPVKDSTRVTS
jgi:hypothetical protein